MAINFNQMAMEALTTQDEGLKQLLQQQQRQVLSRNMTRSEMVMSRAQLAAARMPHRNPYDNLTPEQPAPQSVYADSEAGELSQWTGKR